MQARVGRHIQLLGVGIKAHVSVAALVLSQGFFAEQPEDHRRDDNIEESRAEQAAKDVG